MSALAFRGAIATLKVANTFAGTKELAITFRNTTGAAQTGIIIKSGAHRTSYSTAGGANEFSSPAFASNAEFQTYFQKVRSVVTGCRITTTVTTNFDSRLAFTQKEPDGTETPAYLNLSSYKQQIGGGAYGTEIVIPPADLTMVLWPALEIVLSSLAANSEITFYFKVKGWNATAEFTPLKSASL